MIMWAIIGIVGLAALVISFRIARRRSISLDGYRARRDAEFQKQEQEMDAAAFAGKPDPECDQRYLHDHLHHL